MPVGGERTHLAHAIPKPTANSNEDMGLHNGMEMINGCNELILQGLHPRSKIHIHGHVSRVLDDLLHLCCIITPALCNSSSRQNE